MGLIEADVHPVNAGQMPGHGGYNLLKIKGYCWLPCDGLSLKSSPDDKLSLREFTHSVWF